MTRKSKFAIGAVAVLATSIGYLFVVAQPVRPPGFMKADRWELVQDVLNPKGPKGAFVSRQFNVHRDIEDLADDCLHSPIFFRCDPVPNSYRYLLTPMDKNCAIRWITLEAGRLHWGKSYYVQDHPVPADYAAGWTVVTVDYQPNFNAKARDLWENRILAAFGKKPTQPSGAYALIGMRIVFGKWERPKRR